MKKTVIIQGRVHEWTQRSVDNFLNFSGYRVIFSTWRGEKQLPKGCEIILLEDPGEGPIQNFTRQLEGFNGVQDIDDGFLVKTRSSTIHEIDPFSLFEKKMVIQNEFSLFQHKVFVNNIMTIDPRVKIPGEGNRNFSITDWVLFGMTSDVKKWYQTSAKPIFKHVNCCEQVFTVSNFLKTPASHDLILEEFNQEKYFNLFLNFLKTNFAVKNTYSTMKCVDAKYSRQPENLPFYIKEDTELGI